MTTQRKVRDDFDLTKEYSVDVKGCTKAEQEEVQQAFFDVGILWTCHGAKYNYPHAVQYTNTSSCGSITTRLMYGTSTKNCNMSAEEFLELVYEPEQQGHVHSESMALYAEDAKTTDKPWELWQIRECNGNWNNAEANPVWLAHAEYRRKPKTHTVHGVEVPDLRVVPKGGEWYWFPDAGNNKLVTGTAYYCSDAHDRHRATSNLCYEPTEVGRQAAILHAKAWLGVAV